MRARFGYINSISMSDICLQARQVIRTIDRSDFEAASMIELISILKEYIHGITAFNRTFQILRYLKNVRSVLDELNNFQSNIPLTILSSIYSLSVYSQALHANGLTIHFQITK